MSRVRRRDGTDMARSWTNRVEYGSGTVLGSPLRGAGSAQELKVFLFVTLACLSACSWFGSRKAPLPDPTELIVTGAPGGSIVFVDGARAGEATAANDHPQVVTVAAGPHTVEIHLDDKVVYREETYVGTGERRVVTVLSGLPRSE